MWKSLILQAEKEDEPFGRKPRRPATKEEIELTVKLAKKKLNVDLPEGFLNFLRFRNGFGYEGLLVYGAVLSAPASKQEGEFYRDIVEVNAIWRERDEHKNYLFFADSDMYLYGLKLASGKYEQQDRYSSDVLQVYPDFDQMIADTIKIKL
jgi:hypothetical protein